MQVGVHVSDLPLSVAEDDGLCDGQRVVQIAQSVKLPLLPLHGDKELLYSLQGQLVTEAETFKAYKERWWRCQFSSL